MDGPYRTLSFASIEEEAKWERSRADRRYLPLFGSTLFDSTQCNQSISSMALRVLSASHVEQVSSSLNISELLDLAAISFKAVSSGRGFIMPQRLTVASDTNTTLFMPASMNNVGTTIKVVSVPTAREAGLSATTLVLDDRTGAVKGVVNARKLTALRTAAG